MAILKFAATCGTMLPRAVTHIQNFVKSLAHMSGRCPPKQNEIGARSAKIQTF
jgi:hypothetical protein